jgi:hypothetical protein
MIVSFGPGIEKMKNAIVRPYAIADLLVYANPFGWPPFNSSLLSSDMKFPIFS